MKMSEAMTLAGYDEIPGGTDLIQKQQAREATNVPSDCYSTLLALKKMGDHIDLFQGLTLKQIYRKEFESLDKIVEVIEAPRASDNDRGVRI